LIVQIISPTSHPSQRTREDGKHGPGAAAFPVLLAIEHFVNQNGNNSRNLAKYVYRSATA
jgi:hypothetical protein